MSNQLLILLALGTIKGIAQAGEEFTPAERGLTEKDVAELLACGAANVQREALREAVPEAVPEAASAAPAAAGAEPAEPAEPAAPAAPAKPAKPGKGRAAP